MGGLAKFQISGMQWMENPILLSQVHCNVFLNGRLRYGYSPIRGRPLVIVNLVIVISLDRHLSKGAKGLLVVQTQCNCTSDKQLWQFWNTILWRIRESYVPREPAEGTGVIVGSMYMRVCIRLCQYSNSSNPCRLKHTPLPLKASKIPDADVPARRELQ